MTTFARRHSIGIFLWQSCYGVSPRAAINIAERAEAEKNKFAAVHDDGVFTSS